MPVIGFLSSESSDVFADRLLGRARQPIEGDRDRRRSRRGFPGDIKAISATVLAGAAPDRQKAGAHHGCRGAGPAGGGIMPGYVASLVSNLRGTLAQRRTPTRPAALEAAAELLVKAEELPAYHNETVSIRIGVDPDNP
jgi:hypothetical protein